MSSQIKLIKHVRKSNFIEITRIDNRESNLMIIIKDSVNKLNIRWIQLNR